MGSSDRGPAPGKRDPEGRRQAIVDAAAELIVTGGSASLTHRAVAAKAGVALGSTTHYFTSIDELRDTALALLADRIDTELDQLRGLLDDFAHLPERCAEVVHDFLRDSRQVHASLALMSAGRTDPHLRTLALQWTTRLTQALMRHLGFERAIAIETYLNGATIHAALHDSPLSQEQITDVFRALLAIPTLEIH